MVGFDPILNPKLTEKDYLLAGATSGLVTRFLCQPFDVLKIRFQLQVCSTHKTSTSSGYRGIFHATRTILREEGAGAFWKGHVPAQVLSIVYGAVQFMTFEFLTFKASTVLREKAESNKILVHFLCGGAAGCSATFASQPFDVVRTRLVAQGEPKTYQGIQDAVRTMLKHEGPVAFYKGLLPTLLQIAPLAGTQFGSYRLFQQIWDRIYKGESESHFSATLTKSMICGSLAGLTSKSLVYPLDLIKKRLEIQGFTNAKFTFGVYNGFLHCLVQIFRTEGLLGYFKGYAPSVLKAIVSTAIHFTAYDKVCELLVYSKTS